MSNANSRIAYWDNAKAILIFLVVLGHLLPVCGTLVGNSVAVFIYTFHMPLFIFIAGLFSKNVDKARNSAFFFLKIYIVFRIFYAFIDLFTSRSFDSFKILLSPTNTLWYIWAMFWWRFFLKEIHDCKYLLLITAILQIVVMMQADVSNFLGLQRTIAFLFWFCLGYKTEKSIIDNIKRLNPAISIGVLAMILLAVYFLMRKNICDFEHIMLSFQRGITVYQFSNCWIGVASYILVFVISIISCLAAASLIPSKYLIITEIGKATLPIYLFTAYLPFVMIWLFQKFDFFSSKTMRLGAAVIASFAAVYLFSRSPFKKIIKIIEGK